jgi:phospholipid/cholesterol/gamma-HCH transport system substrate-binding protein
MNRGSLAGPIIKSLAFILVTVLATALLALSIASAGVGNTVGYNAVFTDVTGLNPGDSVRIAGVQIGQVDSIKVAQRSLARVHFSVRKDRPLPASATAAVRYLNLVGQRYIELEQGAGPLGQNLPRGATIPVDRTQPALNLTQLFNGFQPLFQALSPSDVNQLAGEIIQVLQGEGTTVESLIATVGQLTSTLAGKDQVIGDVIDNLTTVVNSVNNREGRFNDLISTLRQLVHGFAADRKPIGESLSSLSDLTTNTVKLLDEGRAPIKADIAQLGRFASLLNRNEPLVQQWLQRLPAKMTTLARLSSYGSWLNFYMCQATITGVKWDVPDFVGAPTPTGPPPTGIALTEPRCKS